MILAYCCISVLSLKGIKGVILRVISAVMSCEEVKEENFSLLL